MNKKDESVSGIYLITNKVNGKFYLGSSICIRARWNRHRRMLQNRCHFCVCLQNAWNKYGEKSFIFQILACVPNKEDLIAVEQYFLDLLQPFKKKNGYNIRKVAHSNLGLRPSEVARKRMSKAQKKIDHAHNKGKKMLPQVKEAMRMANLGKHRTQEVKDKIRTTRFKRGCGRRENLDSTRLTKMVECMKTNWKKPEFVAARNKAFKKRTMQKFPPFVCLETGQIFDYIKDAADVFKTYPYMFSKHLRGEIKHVKGFHFEYIEHKKETC